MSLPPKPPVFFDDAEQHRRQIADYCRAVGDAVGEVQQQGFEYVLQGTAGETPTAGGWTRQTLTGSNRTLRFHVEDRDGKDRTGAWGLVQNGDRITISNEDTDKAEIYDATADATIASDVVTISCTEVLVSTAFVVGDVGFVRASAIGASDASTVTYTQGNEPDWSQSSPTVVSSSLDELASRTSAVENQLPQTAQNTPYSVADTQDWYNGNVPINAKDALDNLAARSDYGENFRIGEYNRKVPSATFEANGEWYRVGNSTPQLTQEIRFTRDSLNATDLTFFIEYIDAGSIIEFKETAGTAFERYRAFSNAQLLALLPPATEPAYRVIVQHISGNGVAADTECQMRFGQGSWGTAQQTSYTPGDASNWFSPVPNETADALDRLAARTRMVLVARAVVSADGQANQSRGTTWTKMTNMVAVDDDAGLWDQTNQQYDLSNLTITLPSGWHYECGFAGQAYVRANSNDTGFAQYGVGANGNNPQNTGAQIEVVGSVAFVDKDDAPYMYPNFSVQPFGPLASTATFDVWGRGDNESSSVRFDGTKGQWFQIEVFAVQDTLSPFQP